MASWWVAGIKATRGDRAMPTGVSGAWGRCSVRVSSPRELREGAVSIEGYCCRSMLRGRANTAWLFAAGTDVVVTAVS